MNFLKNLLENAKDPKTTVIGVLGIVGLFTPVSPVIIAAATSAASIFLATSPKKKETK